MGNIHRNSRKSETRGKVALVMSQQECHHCHHRINRQLFSMELQLFKEDGRIWPSIRAGFLMQKIQLLCNALPERVHTMIQVF